jgi:hypothetical protein
MTIAERRYVWSCWLAAPLEKESMSGGTLVKKNLIWLLAILSLTVFCSNEAPKAGNKLAQEKSLVTKPAPDRFTGIVLETIKADRYTYINVDTGAEKIWAATPLFRGKVGDTVTVSRGLAMQNFHSKALNRDFELVYFVEAIRAEGNIQTPRQKAQMPVGHPPVADKVGKSQIEVSGVKKVEGGKTVAEIFTAKEDLAGKKVIVRGKVVKFTPRIMGKNWLHLQDGSGTEGTNDLTVTTNEMVKVGDLILVSGVISVDRDFGFGYSYEVILEDARVTVE